MLPSVPLFPPSLQELAAQSSKLTAEIGTADEMDQVVFQSEKGYFLRILKTEISVTKKNALGVRGMKLTGEDRIHHAYLLESRQEYAIEYHDKPYVLNKVKLAKRDTKGVKPRI